MVDATDTQKTTSTAPAPVGVATVVAGQGVKAPEKIVVSGDDGIDLETLNTVIKKLRDENENLRSKIQEREGLDADIIRKTIVQKSKHWPKPFSYDELKSMDRAELDDLNVFVERAPKAPEISSDQVEKITNITRIRQFPRITKDSAPYETNKHVFTMGQ